MLCPGCIVLNNFLTCFIKLVMFFNIALTPGNLASITFGFGLNKKKNKVIYRIERFAKENDLLLEF